MALFRVDPQVFGKLPGVCFGVVVARGIDNRTERPEVNCLLEREVLSICERMSDVNIKEYPAVVLYREAFLALGFNPNKFMCSVEALCKRALKGSPIPKINPVVDLGNAMSLRYVLPMGAHDISKLNGDLEVRFAADGDSFLPFGETKREELDLGELVYVSAGTVKTRRWIWRQSDDGKIDAASTDVIFPIDGFEGRNQDVVTAAQQDLARFLQEHFDCRISTGLVNARNPSFPL